MNIRCCELFDKMSEDVEMKGIQQESEFWKQEIEIAELQ